MTSFFLEAMRNSACKRKRLTCTTPHVISTVNNFTYFDSSDPETEGESEHEAEVMHVR